MIDIPEALYKSIHDWADVERWVTEKEEESRNLDFKTSTFKTGDQKLPKDDLVNIAKSVSGFANVDGGLLVFGVGTSNSGSKDEADFASELRPIPGVRRFHKLVQDRLTNCTMPPVAGLESKVITCSQQTEEGVVLLLVPKSQGGPHRTQGVPKEYGDKYYMRTSSNTVPMDHGLLAAQFTGRIPPQLEIGVERSKLDSVIFILRNSGRGPARSLVLEATAQGAWLGDQDLFEPIGLWEAFPEHHGTATESCVFLPRAGFVLFHRSLTRVGTMKLTIGASPPLINIRACAEDCPPIHRQVTGEKLPSIGAPARWLGR